MIIWLFRLLYSINLPQDPGLPLNINPAPASPSSIVSNQDLDGEGESSLRKLTLGFKFMTFYFQQKPQQYCTVLHFTVLYLMNEIFSSYSNTYHFNYLFGDKELMARQVGVFSLLVTHVMLHMTCNMWPVTCKPQRGFFLPVLS